MRYLAAVVMLGLAAASLLLPTPEASGYGSEPGTVVPPVSICPIVEAAERSTEIAVLSSINGPGRISTFSAGSETGSLDFRTGGSGSVVVSAGEAGGIGVSGALIEMPSETTASGVLTSGPESRAAEACADIPAGEAFLSGGSTASGAGFVVELLNPYAGEAVLDLTVTSDAGIESDDRFDSVIVPPLSTLTVSLSDIIPGREDISVYIETLRGSALAVGRQDLDGESSVWRAVAPGQDWWLPVPEGGGSRQLLISTPSNAPIDYQVDVYGLGGEVESYQESYDSGSLEARSLTRIDLTAITPDAIGVRVIGTGPLVATLWMEDDGRVATTTASPVDAPVWLLPGASAPPGGSGSLVVLNSGVDDVTVNVRSLQETSLTRNFDLQAERVLTVPLVAADGYRVESTGPVVVLWTSEIGGTGTVAGGIPIQDG
ncbi:MAG: DUF5719 family protein [Acidimicrobiia bacterium]|jgi:hypothetical protein